ncbi:MAG: hypothetical protein N2515_03690, partial [Deltaproteobacteria bacterium]|nr:hypothetical protein [Deltaproteobacteria bacterium]
VWTRDTSYSVDLGLAPLDPLRSMNSLLFKVSERREGGGAQIVQDTGSGGSYPVSSDRVVWALGAEALLVELDASLRNRFVEEAYRALLNTLEHDRLVIFDETRGLYRGETSFLDWREQSYPAYTASDTTPIAESESLSTNVLHLHALRFTAHLAQLLGENTQRDRLRAQADALRQRIREVFWNDSEGALYAFTPNAFDRAPVRRYDLLAIALSILNDVVSPDEGRRVLSGYPHLRRGAPVIAPQIQFTPIYHNRAQWPFVTAYESLAAAKAEHAAAFTHALLTLVRGAALSLSNMENYEVSTGLPYREEGPTSGPVVNSHRQLWSVAGYIGAVVHGLFGLSNELDGLHIKPFVTVEILNSLFGVGRKIALEDWPVRGKRVSVVLHLPAKPGYPGTSLLVGRILLNGDQVDSPIRVESLGESNRIDVFLAPSPPRDQGRLMLVDEGDYRNVFGPRTPRITSMSQAGTMIRLHFDLAGENRDEVRVNVYRNGVRIASNIRGEDFLDIEWDLSSPRTPCYSIETCYALSQNCSHRSEPICHWGPGLRRARAYDASAFTAIGGALSSNHGRLHYEPWGDPGHRLEITHTAVQSGRHFIQLFYGNGSGPINTGITCVPKRVIVEHIPSGRVVGSGVVAMPQLGTWDRWEESTMIPVELQGGERYRISVVSDDTTINMSHFRHFERYGGTGGAAPFVHVNIAEIRVLAM